MSLPALELADAASLPDELLVNILSNLGFLDR